MSKRPSVFDTAPLIPPAVARGATAGQVDEAAVPASSSREKRAQVKATVYLDPAVHDVLREIAFHERKKVHDLFVEGLDQVLTSRRHATVKELTAKGKTA